MKSSIPSLAALLVAGVSAQTTIVNDPADTGIVTSYYSVCPTTTSTTITLPSTLTICPGGICEYPTITAVPTPITVFGPDGRETIYNVDTTILPALCDGGVCGATYTISEECPCTAGPKTVTIDSCPAGFTTTVVECSVCAANGGPSTVTLTTPVPSGPYASQTPAMGPAANAPAAITTAPTAVSNGGSGSGTGSGSNAGAPGAAASNGGSSAAAVPDNANTAVANSAASAANTPVVANTPAMVNSMAPAANTPAANSPVGPASRVGGAWSSGYAGKNGTSVTGAISPVISPYMGSASKVTIGASMAFAGLIGVMAWLL